MRLITSHDQSTLHYIHIIPASFTQNATGARVIAKLTWDPHNRSFLFFCYGKARLLKVLRRKMMSITGQSANDLQHLELFWRIEQPMRNGTKKGPGETPLCSHRHSDHL